MRQDLIRLRLNLKGYMDTTLEPVQFEFGFVCDIGRARRGEPNQDAVAVILPTDSGHGRPPLLLVADGLGRYEGGALASQTVVNAFKRVYKQIQPAEDYHGILEKCVQVAHQDVRALGVRDARLALMGSTIAAAILTPQHLFVLNVGDSRVYLLNNEKIRQVSHDHSWVAAQVRAGVLTEAEARENPSRNRLTMAITAKRAKVEWYRAEEELAPQDIVLLCSDGLWSVIPETLIHATAAELPPQMAADKLVSMANKSAGPDNISVIVARRAGALEKNTAAGVQDTNP